MNQMSVLRNAPTRISDSPTGMTQLAKSGRPKTVSSGVMMSSTSEVVMAAKEAPMTTATARSMTVPLSRKSRRSPSR